MHSHVCVSFAGESGAWTCLTVRSIDRLTVRSMGRLTVRIMDRLTVRIMDRLTQREERAINVIWILTAQGIKVKKNANKQWLFDYVRGIHVRNIQFVFYRQSW